MSDETRRIKRGDAVTVRIADDGAGAPIDERAGRRGMAPDDSGDDDILVFKKKSVTFYDLGTRLRSVANPGTFDRLRRVERTDPIETAPHDGYYNEYVELNLEKGKNVNSFGLTLSEIALIETELLRGDPLGHSQANGSGRQLPNAMQLPYESEWLYVDVTTGGSRVALAQPDKRPTLDVPVASPNTSSGKWKKTEVDVTGERWNPLNLAAGLVGSPGSLTVKAGSLRVDCAAHYESFDTNDAAKYKWTADPSYSAEETGPPSVKKNTRVFLRPRIHHTSFGYVIESNTGGHATPGQAQILTRLPVYPLAGKLIRTDFSSGGGFKMVITRGFAAAGSAALERSAILPVDRTAEETSDLAIIGGSSFVRYDGDLAYAGGGGFSGHSQPLITGQLVAIIETGDSVHYGWAKADVDTSARRAFIFGEQAISFLAGASLSASNWQCPPVRLYTGPDDSSASTANPTRLYQA